MAKHTYRVVTRARDGSLRIRDFDSEEPLLKIHIKVGVDDCSTDLSLRGKPVFRGLVGPMPDGKGVARYESPEVFETLTREWIKAPIKRRRRRSTKTPKAATETTTTTKESADQAEDESAKILPMPSASQPSPSTETKDTVAGAPVVQDSEPPQVASEASEDPDASESLADVESARADQAKDSVAEKAAEPKAEDNAAGKEAAGDRASEADESPAADAPPKSADRQSPAGKHGVGRGTPATQKAKKVACVECSQKAGTSKSSSAATCGKS